MIISIDIPLDKTQHPFVIKNLQPTRNVREFPQLDKEHLPKNTIANILNSEKLAVFPKFRNKIRTSAVIFMWTKY